MRSGGASTYPGLGVIEEISERRPVALVLRDIGDRVYVRLCDLERDSTPAPKRAAVATPAVREQSFDSKAEVRAFTSSDPSAGSGSAVIDDPGTRGHKARTASTPPRRGEHAAVRVGPPTPAVEGTPARAGRSPQGPAGKSAARGVTVPREPRVIRGDARAVREGVGGSGRRPTPARGRPQKWPDEKIIQALKTWIEERGEVPLPSDWRHGSPKNPASATVRIRWGSWEKFCEAAGVTPRTGVAGRKRGWTKERVVAAMRLHRERTGRSPSSEAWKHSDRGDDYPNTKVVQRLFGTWLAAIKEAGIPPTVRGVHAQQTRYVLTPSERMRVAIEALESIADGCDAVEIAEAALKLVQQRRAA